MKQYAVERLFPANAGEGDTWQELKTLLGQRIAEGPAGDVSAKSIATIVDEELGGN
jgi:hypothetical protein